MSRAFRTSAACAAATLLAACGGGGDAGGTPPRDGPLACIAMPAEATFHDDGSASSEWKDVLVDARHRIWVAGYDRGVTGQTSIEPAGDARGVVRVLAGHGAPLFDSGSRFDSGGADVAEALAMTADGAVHVLGRTTGTLAGPGNRGQFDLFAARGDAAQPAASWRVAQFGDERPQHPRLIVAAGPRTLFVTGYDDDHVPTHHVEAWADAFAARLDVGEAGAGDPVTPGWVHRSGSQAQDFASALALHQGHVFIGGAVTGGPQRGMFVRKLGADGAAVWTARYTSSGADHVAALARLPDGSLLMAGSVMGSFRGGASRGGQDLFLARISPDDGAVLWSTQLGSSGTDWLTDAKVDASGNVFLYGETDGAFVDGRGPAGSNDFFLLKLRTDGTAARAWQWGTAGDDMAASMALDGCGRAIAVGSVADGARRRAVVWFPQGQ